MLFQSPYLLRAIFILIPLLILAIIAWRLWRNYHLVQQDANFTASEKVALIRQIIALVGFFPFLLMYGLLFVIGQGFALELLTNSYLSKGYFLIAAVILGYIAVSSMRNQVSILRGRGQSRPLQGRKAVWSGILMIIGLVSVGLFFLFSPFA